MTNLTQLLSREGIAFFGRINAGVSHKLKNILATISESAGLISDLMELAENGRKIDPARLRSVSRVIVDEIQRGFNAIKRMNTFAHSVDVPIDEIALDEFIGLAVDLSQFVSYSSVVDFRKPDPPLDPVVTHKLLMLDLLYETILLAYRKAGPEGRLEITIEPEGESLLVVLKNERLDQEGNLPGPNLEEVYALLGVTLSIGKAQGEWRVLIPAKHDIQG